MSVIPDTPYIRRRDGEQRATFFELFFDLVYGFAITQLSHHLLGQLSWSGAAQTGFEEPTNLFTCSGFVAGTLGEYRCLGLTDLSK